MLEVTMTKLYVLSITHQGCRWSSNWTQHSEAFASRSPAEIVGSNHTGGNGYLSVVSVVCCQVEVSAAS